MKSFLKKSIIAALCIGVLFGTYDTTAYARTSAGVASKAGKILRSGGYSKGVKSVAGSALSQRQTRRSK